MALGDVVADRRNSDTKSQQACVFQPSPDPFTELQAMEVTEVDFMQWCANGDLRLVKVFRAPTQAVIESAHPVLSASSPAQPMTLVVQAVEGGGAKEPSEEQMLLTIALEEVLDYFFTLLLSPEFIV